MKRSLLSFLNAKIETIKSEIIKSEKVAKEAMDLLSQTEDKLNNLPKKREQILEDVKNSTKSFITESEQDLDLAIKRKRDEQRAMVQYKHEKLYDEMQQRLLQDTEALVINYLESTNNHSLSDLEIGKNLSKN